MSRQGWAQRPAVAMVAAAAGACFAPVGAGAATITVDVNQGSTAANGNCSLGEAIVASNDDASVDDCHRGNGVDTIKFEIAGSPVIAVAAQLPDVTERATIDGTSEPDFAGEPVVVIDNGGGVATGLETTADRVVIKGLAITDFLAEGVRIDNDRNKIVGSLIGTDPSHTDHGNGTGILLEGAHSKVGGGKPSAGNVISGNGLGGGVVAAGDDNTVQGNILGLAPNGSAGLANSGSGVELAGDGNRALDNIVSLNATGVDVSGDRALVRSNLIGTNAGGDLDRGNENGVVVDGKRCTIGGPREAHRNVISGSDEDGIQIFNEEEAGRNQVLGNYIGTDIDGVDGLGNDGDGIEIQASNKNVIGGDRPQEANLISDNFVGVRIGGVGEAKGNVVSGNLIGTDASGEADLGNQSGTVRLTTGAQDNTVGGLSKGEGNLMRFTPGGAVSIGGGTTAFGNSILGNSAFDNGEEVIDLAENGVTPNDLGSPPDTDDGPNHLQNFPVLAGANQQQDLAVGELDSTPATSFRIEFFTSDAADDAQRYVGAKTITTNGAGHKDFTFHASVNLPAGDFVTATATALVAGDPADTSELSDQADISVGP